MGYISLGKKVKQLSYFRKLAIGSWGAPTNPVIHTKLTLDVTALDRFLAQSERPISYTVFFAAALAKTLDAYPELNRVLIRNTLYQRCGIKAFIHTHIRQSTGYALLGVSLDKPHTYSLSELATHLESETKRIRNGSNKAMLRAQALVMWCPAWLYRPWIALLDWVLFTLNVNVSWLGIPKDPYGSFGITTIGALGFEEAFVPLFPFSRLPLMLALGKPVPYWSTASAVPVKRKQVSLCFSVDHRYVDGAHLAKPVRYLKKMVQHPEKYGFTI